MGGEPYFPLDVSPKSSVMATINDATRTEFNLLTGTMPKSRSMAPLMIFGVGLVPVIP